MENKFKLTREQNVFVAKRNIVDLKEWIYQTSIDGIDLN